ncbi:MAG: glycerol-3-phosphate 1-O-acyltransferase PlsY [Burkholderiales bacterium]
MLDLTLVVAAYLIGSISFAVLVSFAFGLPDPHSYGSGNPGATNVLRTGRKSAAALTLIGDASKGAVALWFAQLVGMAYELLAPTLAAVALAAFLGHLYPLYFRFKGGKGVATAAGILLVLDWRLGILAGVVWLLVAGVARVSSLAALAAAAVAPLGAWYLSGVSYETGAVLLMSLLLVWRHRANIAKLIDGSESRIKLLR